LKAGDGVRGPECQSVGRTHLSSGLTPLSRFGTCGGLFATAGGDRHQERAHADPSAQRKLDRGAGRGQPTPRVPRSHHHPRRTASEHRASRVRRLLQPRSTAPDLGTTNSGQQCPLIQRRSSHSPDPRRSTSRLRTSRLMGIWTFATPRGHGWVGQGAGLGLHRSPMSRLAETWVERLMRLKVRGC
jgi:hypothetical protein